jgi:hypothetical protein
MYCWVFCVEQYDEWILYISFFVLFICFVSFFFSSCVGECTLNVTNPFIHHHSRRNTTVVINKCYFNNVTTPANVSVIILFFIFFLFATPRLPQCTIASDLQCQWSGLSCIKVDKDICNGLDAIKCDLLPHCYFGFFPSGTNVSMNSTGVGCLSIDLLSVCNTISAMHGCEIATANEIYSLRDL